MAIAVCHQLVGLLTRGIKADWMIDAVVDRKRHLCVCPVDAGTTGVDKMLDSVMPAHLEYVQKSYDVAVNVCVRILQAVAYPGLSCQMHHSLEVTICE